MATGCDRLPVLEWTLLPTAFNDSTASDHRRPGSGAGSATNERQGGSLKIHCRPFSGEHGLAAYTDQRPTTVWCHCRISDNDKNALCRGRSRRRLQRTLPSGKYMQPALSYACRAYAVQATVHSRMHLSINTAPYAYHCMLLQARKMFRRAADCL